MTTSSPKLTIELTLHGLEPDEAGALWEKLALVAQGFLRDGHDVLLATYSDDGELADFSPATPSTEEPR